MIKIDIKGIPQTQKYLKKTSNNIQQGTTEGLTQASLHVQNEVKLSIAGRKSEIKSVDTGRFLNSIDKSVSKNNAIVFSDLDYAKFLEYGTSRFRARRHFENTKDREKTKIKEILQKSINKKI